MTPEQQAAIAAARARRQQAQPAPEAPEQSYGGGMLDAMTQGVTMGFGDELTGLESAVLGRTPEGGWFDYSKPFGERYDRAVAAERGQQDAFSESNPVSSTAAEIGGALATGVGAARQGLTLAGRMGRGVMGAVGAGATEGAIYGGLYGAGEADGGDRLAGAGYGAATGAAVGGVTSGVMGQISKILSNRQAATQAPSTQQLKGMAGAAYERARTANPAFDGFDQWVMQAYRALPDEGYHANLHPQLKVVLDRVEELSRNGTSPNFRELEQLRRLMQTPAGGFTNPDQQRLARMLRDSLDTFMERAGQNTAPAAAGQTAAPSAARAAFDDVREGRQLYARAKKSELIERMFTMAEDRAGSTNSGGNVENAIRQNMRRILDNDKLRAKFSADEIAAIRTVVRGEPIQNALRGLGMLSPLRGGLMSLLSGGALGAGAYAGNPAMMALPITAAVADQLARAGTQSQAQAVSSMVRGGPSTAALLTQRRISPAAQAVIRALAAQGGGQAGAIAAP